MRVGPRKTQSPRLNCEYLKNLQVKTGIVEERTIKLIWRRTHQP